MAVEPQQINEGAIEQLVSQVRGVLAARVVRDGNGQIAEIHVVGSPDRSPKAMVRDIESILFVRGGLRISYRKISLVQVEETSIKPERVRVQLLGLTGGTDEKPTMIVTLGLLEKRVRGVGGVRPGHNNRPEFLVGFATIHALDQLVGSHGRLRLENVQRQAFGQIEVYIAHVSLIVDDRVETLLGISMAGDDLAAAARAVLDAVNRRLLRLLRDDLEPA